MREILSILIMIACFTLFCLLLTLPALILGMGISWIIPEVSPGSGVVCGAVLVLGSLYFFLQLLDSMKDYPYVDQSTDSEGSFTILASPRPLRRKNSKSRKRGQGVSLVREKCVTIQGVRLLHRGGAEGYAGDI